jgi:hypothetical protein
MEIIGALVVLGVIFIILKSVYPRKQYGVRSTTKLGIVVRSRAEQKIADYFDSIGLRFEYEREIRTGIWIFTTKLSSPDFYLPDYDVYVEYWGMLNVPNDYDRSQYTNQMKYKMARYYDLGIKFVSIYPDDMKNLDWIFRNKFAKVAGKRLPQSIKRIQNDKL